MTNSGTLTNSGSLWNGTIPPAYGFASNHTADMLDNTGTLNNFNLLENYGTLNNNSGGTLTSTGTLINNAILNNNTGGTLTNSVSGTLTNHGTVTNSGTVYDYGFINGAGTYTQTAGLIKVNGSPDPIIHHHQWRHPGRNRYHHRPCGRRPRGTLTGGRRSGHAHHLWQPYQQWHPAVRDRGHGQREIQRAGRPFHEPGHGHGNLYRRHHRIRFHQRLHSLAG